MSGIYEAFEPVSTTHVPAAAPPDYGFGTETLSAGRKAGLAGTDWGGHQYNYESDIVSAFKEGLKKKGLEPPQFSYESARIGARVKDAQVDDLPIGVRKNVESYRKFWDIVKATRTADPKFMADFADVVDANSVREVALKRRAQDEEAGGAVYDKSSGMGKAAWWLGNFSAGFSDPLSYIPIGGGLSKGATVGWQIFNTAARDAALNAAVTLAVEPLTRKDAKTRGQDRTIGDLAVDTAFSAGIGGLIGAVDAGIATTLMKEGKAGLAAVTEAIGPDQMTPDERAAAAVIGRDLDIREVSPFLPTPEGEKAHGSRLAIALASLEADRPVPEFRSQLLAGTAAVEAPDIKSIADRLIMNESGGKATARNPMPGQTASGLGQFTDATWLNLFKQRLGANGKTDAQILALKTDPVLGRKMTEIAVDEHVKWLKGIGAPVTDGNVYLMHFLGPRDALKVLRAAPETPIAEILSKRIIDVNPGYLKGKNAGELLAEMDRRMGGEGIARPAQADGIHFRDDLFDSPEAMIVARESIDSDAPDFSFEESAAIARSMPDDGFEPSALPETASTKTGAFGPIFTDLGDDWKAAVVKLTEEQSGEVVGAIKHSVVGPIDVVWGEAPSPGRQGFGLAKIIERHPEVVEDLPEIVSQMPARSRPEETGNNRWVLENETYRAVVAPDYFGEPKHWLVTAFERKDTPGGQTSRRAPLSPDGRSTGAEQGSNIAQVRDIDNEAPLLASDPVADRVLQEVEASPETFSDPQGAGPMEQLDSIVHDLTNEGIDGSFRLADEGAEETLESALLKAEADLAAVEFARNCL